MPYPIRFNCVDESALVVFHPQDTIALDTFVLAAEPLSMTPDPDNWVLDSAHVAGIEEGSNDEVQVTNAGPTIIRGVLLLPRLLSTHASLLSIDGRKVLDLRAGPNDASRLAPGVYFVAVRGTRNTAAVRKVIINR
jgi:hypothetical protein